MKILILALIPLASAFFPIPAGRPRNYGPGCFVPVLDFVISPNADLPHYCPKGTFTLGTNGWPENNSPLSPECQALAIPTKNKPTRRGVQILPHAQGTRNAVKNDVGRQALFSAVEQRGYVVGQTYKAFSYNFFYPPWLLCQYSPQTCEEFKTFVDAQKTSTNSSHVDWDEHSCFPAYAAYILKYLDAKYPGWVQASIAHEDKLSDDTFGETDIPLVVLPESNWGGFYVNDSYWDLYLINNNWVAAAFSPNANYYANLPILSTPARGQVTVSQLIQIMPEYQLGGFASLWREAASHMQFIFHGVSTAWLFPTNGVELNFFTYSQEDLNLGPGGASSSGYGVGPGDDEQNTSTNVAGALAVIQFINTIEPGFSVGFQSFANISLPAGLDDHHVAQLSDPYSLNYRLLRSHTPAGY